MRSEATSVWNLKTTMQNKTPCSNRWPSVFSSSFEVSLIYAQMMLKYFVGWFHGLPNFHDQNCFLYIWSKENFIVLFRLWLTSLGFPWIITVHRDIWDLKLLEYESLTTSVWDLKLLVYEVLRPHTLITKFPNTISSEILYISDEIVLGNLVIMRLSCVI
jgi:hypothetical protein